MQIAQPRCSSPAPDRNFVTLQHHHRRRRRSGSATPPLNGRELAVAAYLCRPRRTAADRPRRGPHRGHLAVPLPGRVLAARSGHHGRHRRRRHGAVGHQGQGGRDAALPAARRRSPATAPSPTGTPRAATYPSCSTRSATTWSRATARSASRPASPAWPVYGVAAPARATGAATTTSRAPAGAARRPVEETWDTRAYLRHVPTVFEAGARRIRPRAAAAARRAPPDDAHRRRPGWARRSSRTTCSGWRTCTPGEDQAALRLVRQHTTTPLAIGEVFNSVHDYQTLITERLIDYVRSAVTHTGGITAMKKLLRLRRHLRHQVRACTAPPTSHRSGMAAALHLDLAIHNFGIQEYMRHSERRWRSSAPPTGSTTACCTRATPRVSASTSTMRPLSLPVPPAYLPVNPLRDGTVHDW